jgi:putative ABC transport system permease protein
MYEVNGDSRPALDARPIVAEFVVSAGYFDALRIEMVIGREFDGSDRATTLPVAIVNQQFADRHWPGSMAIGKQLRFVVPSKDPSPWLTVVGVVSNVLQNDRTRQAFDPIVYVPHEQHPQPNLFAFVRTRGDPAGLVGAVQQRIDSMDPQLPIPALGRLADRIDRTYALERNSTAVVTLFAAITMLIASLGLYATASQSVSARTTEIGVRRAIGATAGEIVRLVFAGVSSVVVIGWFIGLGCSLAFVRILRTQLVGVSPFDPASLGAASALLAVAAAMGCGIPAARATRVDPVVALRRE